jgi:hypothetical protein
MSTAVIMTGHARTFATCIHTLKWQVLRHYAAPAFYVSTIKDEDSAGMEATLRKLFPGAAVSVEAIDAQPDLPEPVEPVRFEPYARSVPMQAVLRQLWQLEQGWKLYERLGSEESTFIRVRPDLYFHSFEPPAQFVDAETCHSPRWGTFGGINDRFAVMGEQAAWAYFTAYSFMPKAMEKGCPIHPESLVKAAVTLRGCRSVTQLKTEFSTWRKDGQHRPPEILPWDLLPVGLD